MDNKRFADSNILITGASGYIGKELKILLSNKNFNVKCSSGDLSKKEIWEENLSANVDYIFHLAATEGENKNLAMNSTSVLNLLNVCVDRKIKPKIILASSTNLFGATDLEVVDETSSSLILSEFSAHKLLAENYLKLFYQKYHIPSLILRIPNVYGPSSIKSNFNRSTVNKVIKLALEGAKLKLFDNRGCLRDFLYIDDIVNAFYLSGGLDGKYFKGNFYLLGSKSTLSIEDVWKTIQSKTNSSDFIIDNKNMMSPMEYRSFICNSSRFRDLSSWTDKVPLDKGIDLTIEYLKKDV
jgi:nucleoside-diphosphate-sugar epimerase